MTADRMKMAVARWRTAQGLKALGARTKVLDADYPRPMRRVDLLADVRSSLPSLFGSPAEHLTAPRQSYLPGLSRYLNSLPRVSLSANPSGGINRSLVPFQHKQLPFLYRGGTGPDPYRGGYFKGTAHATPHLDVASNYARGVFPATSVFRTHPKQRFTTDYGMEHGFVGRRLGGQRVPGQESVRPTQIYETLVSPRRNPLVGTYVDLGSGQFVEPPRSVLRQLARWVRPDGVPNRPGNDAVPVRTILSQQNSRRLRKAQPS